MLALNDTGQAVVAGRVVQVIKASGSEADFRLNLRAAVRGFWGGTLDFLGFLESMNGTIHRGLTNAWNEGAGMVGINPGELNDEEKNALTIEINGDLLWSFGFANTINAKSKANGGKLAPLLKRTDMWANRYQAVVSHAMAMAGRDQKLKWVWNEIKEHCPDCRKLNGRVYRASMWNKYDLRPRMRRLNCHGYRCGCRFEPTSDPVTPGRPPII